MPTSRKNRSSTLGIPIGTVRGGAPIAAGGFGCVFKPPIRCTSRGRRVHYNENGVSKLMIERHAKTEMAEIKKVLTYVKKIPHYNRYFLLDGITTCTPGTLTLDDRKGFNDICKSLHERGYTEDNVNSKREHLRLINVPYGGEDIDNFWSIWKQSNASNKTLNKTFAETNTALVDLLMYGIRPLNKKGYVHMDLKGQNILRSTEDGVVMVRVIDWGLSGAIPAKGVASSAQDRVVQYNVPFSNILFATQDWGKRLAKYVNAVAPSPSLRDSKDIGRTSAMRIVAYQQFNDIADEYGDGHLEFLRKLFDRLLGYPAQMGGTEGSVFSPITAAVEYNAAVLAKYVDSSGKFDSGKYFREVYSKNVDVWGFLMAYLPIVDTSPMPWKSNSLENAITRIICEYCLSSKYATTPIPIDKLSRQLLSLNTIVGHSEHPRTWGALKKKASVNRTRKLVSIRNSSTKVRNTESKCCPTKVRSARRKF